MTEAKVLEWIALNWPSLAVCAIMLKVYLKINHFVVEQNRQKKILSTIVDICSDQHEDSAKKIMEAMKTDE